MPEPTNAENCVPAIFISTVAADELAISAAVMVGTTVSTVTPAPVVVAVTATPVFVAESLKLIVKATGPLVAFEATTKDAVQRFDELA